MSTHIRAKKSLGQNFLKDPFYLGKIADAARIASEDQVLEIGPGLGHLTRELSSRAASVLALELDDRLIPVLRREFSGCPNVMIEHADALDFSYDSLEGSWKVVANLPYYISTQLIQRLLHYYGKFTSMTLLLQKEVADRITSQPGTKDYGYLTVLVRLWAEPRREFMIPPGAFTPAPKVDSTVITLSVRRHPALQEDGQDLLIKVVKAAFSQRRKTLRNSLKSLNIPPGVIDSVFDRTGTDLARRAETLSVEEFIRLSAFLKSS